MKPSKKASVGSGHVNACGDEQAAADQRKPLQAAHWFRLAAITGAIVVGFSGCATQDIKAEADDAVRVMRVGPVSAPERTITNFSDALRCMDSLFITYGIRDVAVLVEDLDDKTKKVTAGTKDMLISATSSMTRRSGAIRLNTFGKDSIGLTEWHIRGGKYATFDELPQFVIRGSVSQFDQNLVSREKGVGVAIGNVVSGGVADRASSSRMAIDLNMIHGANFSIVPGVTSQNSIEIRNEGRGVDADATIRKLGINFNMTIAKSEGQAQGLRNLVDLAVIELFGRLSRTPYWTCIGSSPNSAEVGKEIEDWHYAMERNGNLVPFIQYQMRIRGYYAGPIDGKASPALGESVALYRKAMGGEAGRGAIDVDFFKRYLAADHAQVAAQNPPLTVIPGSSAAPSAPASGQSPVATSKLAAPTTVAATVDKASTASPAGNFAGAPAGRLQLAVQSATGEPNFARGQPVQLVVVPNRPAHVHCYLRDDTQQVQRIFPNRFNRDTLVRPGESLQLPGRMRFQIVASPRGSTEAVVCYATERDVIAQLPRGITGADFEALPVRSLDEIKNAFREVSGDQFVEGVFHVRTR